MADNTKVYPSGLTEKEAQEFGEWYMKSMAAWFALAVVAHGLCVMAGIKWTP